MSRIDEALRRGGKNVGQPDTFNVPSTRALDWFAPGNDTPTRDEHAAADAAVERPAPVAVAAPPTPIVAAPVVLRPTPNPPEANPHPIGASGFPENLVRRRRVGPGD